MKHSKRAAIFASVSGFIDVDDWQDYGNFIVFGKEAFERFLCESENEADEITDSARELATKVKKNRGEILAKEKISIGASPQDISKVALKNWLLGLAPKDIEDLKKQLSQQPDRPKDAQAITDDEQLDAFLAQRLIQILDQAVARLSTFDKMEIHGNIVPHPEYFEEAHLCDLFGLKIACAVLCRAVLEEALKQQIDPNGELRANTRKPSARKRERSKILAMLDEASKREKGFGYLDGERINAGELIKSAGDKAIHDIKTFNSDYAGRMAEIIDNTRKIVIDLYAKE